MSAISGRHSPSLLSVCATRQAVLPPSVRAWQDYVAATSVAWAVRTGRPERARLAVAAEMRYEVTVTWSTLPLTPAAWMTTGCLLPAAARQLDGQGPRRLSCNTSTCPDGGGRATHQNSGSCHCTHVGRCPPEDKNSLTACRTREIGISE